jgi:hypothetical protein
MAITSVIEQTMPIAKNSIVHGNAKAITENDPAKAILRAAYTGKLIHRVSIVARQTIHSILLTNNIKKATSMYIKKIFCVLCHVKLSVTISNSRNS